MICGMDIGQQSTLNILENRWGAMFESERGLAKFLSFFSLEWSWKMHGSMILFLRSASWKGRGKVVKIIFPTKVTGQHRKLRVNNQKLQIVGFMRHFPRPLESKWHPMLAIKAKVRDKQSFHITRPQTHVIACLCFARIAAEENARKAGACAHFFDLKKNWS